MTSREIIKRCIHFQDPPRVGMYFSRFGHDDTIDVFDFYLRDEHGVDPWGITWMVHPDFPSIGMPKAPLVSSLEDLDKLRAPDPKEYAARVAGTWTGQDPFRPTVVPASVPVLSLKSLTKAQRDKYRFVAASCGIWEVPHNLRGMEALCEDMLLNPELAHRLIAFCTDFWVNFLRELAPLKGEVDALYMFDDWGTQQNAMIGPPMWREFFAKPYRRIADAAHAMGMDFWLHSCGRVTSLIGEFIEAGIDLLNPFQSGACGYEEVAQKYAGKICFLTTVDTQSTLTHGTPEQVLAECKRLATWKTPHGGLIVGSYSYDAPEANERVVYDFFKL
ncbi:MAG: uroporphyrinogen decarboxylase family protein [Kiritimatiellae bacterium]|nr:uroporphyrinogen decarboxylase family protein [Kiritimatiellia bacterium]